MFWYKNISIPHLRPSPHRILYFFFFDFYDLYEFFYFILGPYMISLISYKDHTSFLHEYSYSSWGDLLWILWLHAGVLHENLDSGIINDFFGFKEIEYGQYEIIYDSLYEIKETSIWDDTFFNAIPGGLRLKNIQKAEDGKQKTYALETRFIREL